MIKITDEWYLDNDKHQWIVKRAYQSNKHKDTRFHDQGYYPTLSRACDALSGELVKDEAASDLKTLIHATETLSGIIRVQVQEEISLTA